MKECPMCGEPMRFEVRQVSGQVPGRGEATVREWICPECDYFEEAETEQG